MFSLRNKKNHLDVILVTPSYLKTGNRDSLEIIFFIVP